MINFRIVTVTLAAVLGGLAGCSATKVVMKVDPALQDNAIVYKIKYPDSLADKISGNRLNVTFGPYRVRDADLSWTRSNTEAEEPSPIISIKKVQQSGNSTTTTEISGGPTSLFGFTRPAAEGEPAVRRESRTITYQFIADQKTTWHAQCEHNAVKRIIQYEKTSSVEILSSDFLCRYREAGKSEGERSGGEWTLSVDTDGLIAMTPAGEVNTLTALATNGELVRQDGKLAVSSAGTAGYTWHQRIGGSERSVAAISVREEVPRVWIDKNNPEDVSEILAMASTGLLIYGWEIYR